MLCSKETTRRRRGMPLTDWTLAELEEYDPQLPEPSDLETFWSATLSHARSARRPTNFVPVDTGLRLVDTFDVTFAGFAGASDQGWLHAAGQADGATTDGRGVPRLRRRARPAARASAVGTRRLRPLRDGHARPGHRVGGAVARADPTGGGAAHPGFMTRGILDPQSYYYRRVFTDAVRAVEAARGTRLVDGEQRRGRRRQPGRRHHHRRGCARRTCGQSSPTCPSCATSPARPCIADRRPVPRDRPLSEGPPRPDRPGVRARSPYFDVACFGRAGHGAGAVLGRADGPDLPAVDGVRRVQRLRRAEGHRESTSSTTTRAAGRSTRSTSCAGSRLLLTGTG